MVNIYKLNMNIYANRDKKKGIEKKNKHVLHLSQKSSCIRWCGACNLELLK